MPGRSSQPPYPPAQLLTVRDPAAPFLDTPPQRRRLKSPGLDVDGCPQCSFVFSPAGTMHVWPERRTRRRGARRSGGLLVPMVKLPQLSPHCEPTSKTSLRCEVESSRASSRIFCTSSSSASLTCLPVSRSNMRAKLLASNGSARQMNFFEALTLLPLTLAALRR